MVSKFKFQHSVTTTFFFARFSVKALSLWPFCENLIKIKNFWLISSLVRRMSVEHRINPKFLVRLEKTPTEALRLLQEVCGDDTISRTRLFEWHRRFSEERELVEDDHRSGRPSTSRTNENVKRVRQKVRSDCRLTVRMIADELGMNSERVWRIIAKDLGMRKNCAERSSMAKRNWALIIAQAILRPEFDYGCRRPASTNTRVAGDLKSTSSLPSHSHLSILIKFVEL